MSSPPWKYALASDFALSMPPRRAGMFEGAGVDNDQCGLWRLTRGAAASGNSAAVCRYFFSEQARGRWRYTQNPKPHLHCDPALILFGLGLGNNFHVARPSPIRCMSFETLILALGPRLDCLQYAAAPDPGGFGRQPALHSPEIGAGPIPSSLVRNGGLTRR